MNHDLVDRDISTSLAALLHLIEPIDDATITVNGRPAPDWTRLLDDRWIARLSSGEKALVWLGVQLFNGGTIKDPPDLYRALNALDVENRRRFVDAVELRYQGCDW